MPNVSEKGRRKKKIIVASLIATYAYNCISYDNKSEMEVFCVTNYFNSSSEQDKGKKVVLSR